MSKRMSVLTIIYCLALGITMIVSAVFSGGYNLSLIIPVGSAMILAGPTAVLAYGRQSKKVERDNDEREQRITEKAMKFTFYFMTFVLSAYWAYDTAGAGTFLRWSGLLMLLLWGSFIGGYIVNRIRF